MKITVIGAGAMGSAVTQELLDRPEVTRVQVCDARAKSLQVLHEAVQNARLRSFQVDARDPGVLEPILSGSDCVVGCTTPQLYPTIAALCLKQGIGYCDLGSTENVVNRLLSLNEQAAKKAVWIVPNVGLAPGLVNVLCVHGIAQFDEVESAHIRVGDVPLHPEPPFNFRIAWSADKLIDDYTQPVYFIENGALSETSPLAHVERLCFPEPFGKMEAFSTAGALSTLAHNLAGRIDSLDHKTIRWPGHAAQMQFLLELGFGETRSIDVRTHLTYRDILVRRMRQRLGGDFADAVLMRIVLQGTVDALPRTLVYEMVETYDEARDITAIKRCTSIPAASLAVLIAAKQLPGGGAAPPEAVVPPDTFIETMIERGLHIKMTWHDGHVSVGERDC